MLMFDTRLLNEDIPQSDKRFANRDGKLRNVAKYTNQANSNNQNTLIRYSCIRAKYSY